MISKTNDYNLFKKFPGNRAIDSLNLKKIINSIKMNNMLELRPLLVTENMEIIDGQHRLEAAKSLGLDVYFTVQKAANPIDMVLLNNAQKAWGIEDYINFYASQGKKPYQDILKLAKKFSLPPVMVLRYSGTIGGKNYALLKNGGLDIDMIAKESHIQEMTLKIDTAIDFIDEKTIGDKTYLKSTAIKRGLLTLFNHGEFDFDVFMKKLHIGIGRIHHCGTIEQFYEMFKAIYNFKNQNFLE